MAFQFNSKNIFLTYPQAPTHWTLESVYQAVSKFTAEPLKSYVIAKEAHEDGSPHFHVLLCYAVPFRSRNARVFDFDEAHPNIQSARSVKKCYAYCIKDGDYITHGFDQLAGAKPSWATVIAESEDKESFMAAAHVAFPRDFVLSREKLEYFATSYYKKQINYVPVYNDFVIPDILNFWVNDELRSNKPRPKSLYLVGISRLGKTEWARSLGKHIYACGMLNLDNWVDDADYMVIDDVNWDYLPGKKELLGAQQEITLSDKYRKKQTLKWGKPCIYLCNPDADVYFTCKESAWLSVNAIYHRLTRPMFDLPDPELPPVPPNTPIRRLFN